MKIESLREKISEAVSKAEKFTGKNVSFPALAGILLEAKGKDLIVRATNLDLGIEITVPAKIHQEGKVLVPGTLFSQFLSHVRGEKSVVLELKKDLLVFSSNLEDVKFKTLLADDFPIIPRQEGGMEIVIDTKALAEGLKSVLFAVSPASMKPELSSVYVYGEGENIVFAGTDSFRLAEKKIRNKSAFDGSFLLPMKNAAEVLKVIEGMKGDVTVRVNKNQIAIEAEGLYLVSRTVEGSYPDYRQIIPKEAKTEIVCLADDLRDALRATAPFTDRFQQLSLEASKAKKEFVISSRNQDAGELTEKVESAVSGDDVTINFNHRYLSDLFQAISADSISISLNGLGKAAVARGVGDGTFLYVVMPMNR